CTGRRPPPAILSGACTNRSRPRAAGSSLGKAWGTTGETTASVRTTTVSCDVMRAGPPPERQRPGAAVPDRARCAAGERRRRARALLLRAADVARRSPMMGAMWVAPLWIGLLASVAIPTPAPPATALDFAAGRDGASLNGAWHFIVDPYENGYYDYRQLPRAHGYFDDAPPASKSDLVEYDFASSPTLNVPGDWNTQRPELLYY